MAYRYYGMALVEDLELDIINQGDIKPITVINLPLDYYIIGYSRFKLLFN